MKDGLGAHWKATTTDRPWPTGAASSLAWRLDEAVSMAEILAPFELPWFEEPQPVDAPLGASVRAALDRLHYRCHAVPIRSGSGHGVASCCRSLATASRRSCRVVPARRRSLAWRRRGRGRSPRADRMRSQEGETSRDFDVSPGATRPSACTFVLLNGASICRLAVPSSFGMRGRGPALDEDPRPARSSPEARSPIQHVGNPLRGRVQLRVEGPQCKNFAGDVRWKPLPIATPIDEQLIKE